MGEFESRVEDTLPRRDDVGDRTSLTSLPGALDDM
jgi:hypothetical protein